MIKVGIVGATGYAGVELIRLLLGHPHVAIQRLTSRAEAGVRVDRLFPSLRGHIDLAFEDPGAVDFADCDLVFFATPHAVSMNTVPALLDRGIKIIDLSADFRLSDIGVWESWYGTTHAAPDLISTAVYGLPEVNRAALRDASLVACPGCYPTAVQLGFLPLLESGCYRSRSVNCLLRVRHERCGRGAKVNLLLSESTETMKSYGVQGHRHLPEMEQGLSRAAGGDVSLTFVPHLAPMTRGIHATLFATLTEPSTNVRDLFESRFADEPLFDSPVVITSPKHGM